MRKNLNEILDVLSYAESVYCNLPGVGDYPLCSTRELYSLLKPEPRQLTLDELLQMGGQPVWIRHFVGHGEYGICCDVVSRLNAENALWFLFVSGRQFNVLKYGEAWSAYDRPPGGEGR